jgi:hypothetical protein
MDRTQHEVRVRFKVPPLGAENRIKLLKPSPFLPVGAARGQWLRQIPQNVRRRNGLHGVDYPHPSRNRRIPLWGAAQPLRQMGLYRHALQAIPEVRHSVPAAGESVAPRLLENVSVDRAGRTVADEL